MRDLYQELTNELDELMNKALKLHSFLGSEQFKSITPEHAGLLQKQYAVMHAYGEILSKRIALLENQD